MQGTASHAQTNSTSKWLIAIAIIFGLFAAVMDSTIVNIAIPHLQNAFGGSLSDVQWVLTGYTKPNDEVLRTEERESKKKVFT